MNQGSLRSNSAADLQFLMQDLITLAPKLILDVGPQLMLISAKTTLSFLEAAGTLVSANMPRIDLSRQSRGCCCDIPETECPPRCVCDISWKGCPGSKVQATIRVTNTGSSTRTFSFVTTPITGPGSANERVSISPSSAKLAPHDYVDIDAHFTIPSNFHEGSKYAGELRIYGAYEQCVRMTLQIEPPTGKCCSTGHCDVCAGDPPVRIRAHHWYDHFQCTEPCFRETQFPVQHMNAVFESAEADKEFG